MRDYLNLLHDDLLLLIAVIVSFFMLSAVAYFITQLTMVEWSTLGRGCIVCVSIFLGYKYWHRIMIIYSKPEPSCTDNHATHSQAQ